MSLIEKPGTKNWFYRFKYKGREYKGSTFTANVREAEAFERRKRVEIEEADAQASQQALTPTLAKLRDWDIERAERAGRPDKYTKETLPYQWKHVLAYFPSVEKVTVERLDSYVDHRRKQGVRNQTIRRELTTLKRGLTMAWEREYPVTIPRRWPKLPDSDPNQARSGRFWGLPTIHKWLGALSGEAFDMALLALLTGMRHGELYRLSAEFDVYAVEVQPGMEIAAVLMLSKKSTKSKRARQIGLTAQAYELFKKAPFKKDHKSVYQYASKVVLPEGQSVHLRDMRSSFATLADASGDPRGVDMVMGHAGGVPGRYNKLFAERIGKIAKCVEDQVGPVHAREDFFLTPERRANSRSKRRK